MKWLCLAFALLAISAQGQWTQPIKVDNCTTELKRPTMFIDRGSRTTHIFWCQYDTDSHKYKLLFRRQFPDGSFSAIATLDTEHECEEVSITGLHDGQHLFVAYGADRLIAHRHCSNEMKDGCLDIYSLDSGDGGQTWSKPEQVMRNDQADIWNRQYPKILLNPLTNRLWIFYVLSDVERTVYSIGFVTRPGDSRIYSREALLGFRKELIMEVSVALSNFKNALLIHLIWTGEIQGHLHLMQAISGDNGARWTYSEILGTGFGGKFTSSIQMDAGYMILPYLEYTYAPSRLAVTSDRTQSWRLKQLSENSGIAELALCYRQSRADAILFTLLQAEIGVNKFEGEFGFMRLANEVWIRGANPFGKMNLGYDPFPSLPPFSVVFCLYCWHPSLVFSLHLYVGALLYLLSCCWSCLTLLFLCIC